MNIWQKTAFLCLFILLLPILYLLFHLFAEESKAWQHITENLLGLYLQGSLVQLGSVLSLTLLWGVPSAWLVATTDFWGRRFFSWALLLPLSIPAYILSYTYSATLSYTGSIGIFLRQLNGGNFLDTGILSWQGAALMMSLALYPYLFGISKAVFEKQSAQALEAAWLLGKNRYQTFFQVALPLARPALVGGLFLVGMEVLNEYGTYKYFGVNTFTTGIFGAWAKFGDVTAAIRLAACLMLFVGLFILFERYQRGQVKVSDQRSVPLLRKKLNWGETLLAYLACGLPFFLGFLLPFVQIAVWFFHSFAQIWTDAFWVLMRNSVLLCLGASLLTVLVSLLLTYSQRLGSSGKKEGLFWGRSLIWLNRLANLGYAVPGAVIAIGVLAMFLAFDKGIKIFLATQGISIGFVFSGTILSLLLAYLIRFLAVAYQSVESGFEKINPHTQEAARLLGKNSLYTLGRVILPQLQPALRTALILVAIDVMKELPLTLILRPFNFDTLATKAYELADQEFVAEAAVPSLLIILLGLVPIVLLQKK
ncbi:ABC transporter permease [Hugenholtzia roseola]|uniref:ABC transporter permease n=1 Tax=Hugenholtzia roseola TaxID=1002 RepID=UPI000415814B|nr:iron ABC transporter permease [Hugenholtzia roseola]